MAVAVPAGSHAVRLDYLPPGFRGGVALSLVAAVFVVTLVAFPERLGVPSGWKSWVRIGQGPGRGPQAKSRDPRTRPIAARTRSREKPRSSQRKRKSPDSSGSLNPKK